MAAILNFLFSGIGFAYLGSAILSGVVLFISSIVVDIIYLKYTVGMAQRPSFQVFSILGGLSLAVITFAVTKIFNKTIQPKGEQGSLQK